MQQDKQPTKKQIDILMKNGFTYEQVSAMPYQDISTKIGEILGKPTNAQHGAPMAQKTIVEARHDVVIQRTEKPHSYEFGKAGARHKVYYNDVNELKAHIDMLKAAGLFEEDFEVQKL